MPETDVILFADEKGGCPLLEWMDTIPQKAQDKCTVKVERLAELGHELRRPEADYLRDGIYELRTKFQRVNYRMLYFFHENGAIIVLGLIKENVVPAGDMAVAISRKKAFILNPSAYTYTE
jgi:phage-related protein